MRRPEHQPAATPGPRRCGSRRSETGRDAAPTADQARLARPAKATERNASAWTRDRGPGLAAAIAYARELGCHADTPWAPRSVPTPSSGRWRECGSERRALLPLRSRTMAALAAAVLTVLALVAPAAAASKTGYDVTNLTSNQAARTPPIPPRLPFAECVGPGRWAQHAVVGGRQPERRIDALYREWREPPARRERARRTDRGRVQLDAVERQPELPGQRREHHAAGGVHIRRRGRGHSRLEPRRPCARRSGDDVDLDRRSRSAPRTGRSTRA